MGGEPFCHLPYDFAVLPVQLVLCRCECRQLGRKEGEVGTEQWRKIDYGLAEPRVMMAVPRVMCATFRRGMMVDADY